MNFAGNICTYKMSFSVVALIIAAVIFLVNRPTFQFMPPSYALMNHESESDREIINSAGHALHTFGPQLMKVLLNRTVWFE